MITDKDKIINCNSGLYRVYWADGGSSLAAIGSLYDGTRWLAPTNWVTGSKTETNPTTTLEKYIDNIKAIYLLNSGSDEHRRNNENN